MGTIHYDTSFVLVAPLPGRSSARASACSCRTSCSPCRTPWTSGDRLRHRRRSRSSGRSAARSASPRWASCSRTGSTDLIVRGLAGARHRPVRHGLRAARCPTCRRSRTTSRVVVEQSFGNAIADLFLVAAPVALVSLIAVLFLKEVPLGNRSGIEQLLEQEGADARAGRPSQPATRRRRARTAARRPTQRASRAQPTDARARREPPVPVRPGARRVLSRSVRAARAAARSALSRPSWPAHEPRCRSSLHPRQRAPQERAARLLRGLEAVPALVGELEELAAVVVGVRSAGHEPEGRRAGRAGGTWCRGRRRCWRRGRWPARPGVAAMSASSE